MSTRTPELTQVYIDGASRGNPGPAGAGAVFFNAKGDRIAELSRALGETTNNVAEYLALVYALQEAQARGWRRLAVKTDSELLARQVNGQYKVRDATLRLFHDLACEMIRAMDECSIEHISRSLNAQADRLAGRAVAR